VFNISGTCHNVRTIVIVGGEPLLHPCFREICDFVLQEGFLLKIITSGKISKKFNEWRNLNYAMNLFRLGKIFFELSLHFNRNDKDYVAFIERLRTLIDERRKNIAGTNIETQYDRDLNSTYVVSKNLNFSFEEFLEHINSICEILEFTKFKADSENFRGMFQNYQSHFADGEKGLNHSIWHYATNTGLRIHLTVRGQTDISYEDGQAVIGRPELGLCPSVQSSFSPTKITLSSFLVRMDGGIVFGESQCIDSPSPLANIDIHVDEKIILKTIIESLKQIQTHVFLFNRMKAADNCDEGGVEKPCTACPFDRMCTPCWKTKRPWEKGE